MKIEAEISNGLDADFIVCMRVTTPLKLPDNVVGACSICAEVLQHRPNIPMGPALVCMECVIDLAPEKIKAMITPETYREITAYLKKSQH